jgi:glycosyltransferase involved in cell wall biosynthesis
MKILHLTQYISPGGLEKVIFDLSLEQQKSNNSVAVCVYGDLREWIPKFTEAGIEVIEIELRRNSFDWKRIPRLFKIINEFDIIHTHDLGPLFYYGLTLILRSLCFKKKKKSIHTIHGLQNPSNNKKYAFYEKVFLNFISKIVCVGEELKKTYSSLAPQFEKKLHYIPNGVSIKKYPFNEKEISRKSLIEEFKLEQDCKIILYVARILPLKNQAFLIDYFVNHPQYNLLLVGPISNQEYFDSLKKTSKNILFLGSRHDIDNLILATDIYVSSSTSEGLPLSVLEAMSLKTPCLLSNIKAHTQLSTNNNIKCCELYQEDSSESFEKMLFEIFEHGLKNAEAAFTNIETNYSMKHTNNLYLELYKS